MQQPFFHTKQALSKHNKLSVHMYAPLPQHVLRLYQQMFGSQKKYKPLEGPSSP
jgi:hypothetical protein